MRRRRLAALRLAGAVFAAGVAVGPAVAQGPDEPPAARCDRLAASPYDRSDPKRPGIKFDAIDAPAAIAACTDATQASPRDARLHFQLGRALQKAERGADALAAYEAAAAGGYALAFYNMGLLFADGRGVSKDQTRASEYFRKGADLGEAMAAYELGYRYEHGEGVPQDDAKAVELLRRAADLGEAGAQNELGYMYENGRGGLPKDLDQALRFYHLAADQGYDAAIHNVGLFYEYAKGSVAQDDAKAVEYFRRAADLGFARAQTDLGYMYENGRGGLPKDMAQAAHFYRLAADQGNGVAKANLGSLYQSGRGVPIDKQKAVELFKAAADSGDADGIVQGKNNLAWLYAVENRDLDQAEPLAREAVKLDETSPDYKDTLAYVLHRRGKDAEALPFAEAAVASKVQYAAFHMRHGDILDALGRREDAKAAWRKALALPWTKDDEVGEFRRETYEAKLAR